MKTIKQILNRKGNDVWAVSPTDTVYDALQCLAEHDIGALIVQDNGKLVGIFSERDYARKVTLRGAKCQETAVSEVMCETVLYVEPDKSIDECLALMTNKHIRHLPVIEDAELIGVISIGDAVAEKIGEQEFLIEQLSRYITNTL